MAFLADRLYAIDRIERDIAVCECLQTGERITLDVSALPPKAKEGDLIRREGEGFFIDKARTEERLRKLTNRMNRLFDRHKP